MKIRIKGNSLRYRLSKSDIDILSQEGYHEEHTSFGPAVLTYALQRKEDISELAASYEDHKITTFIPASFLQGWDTNNVIGTEARMPIGNNETMYLLVEKDFKCLDDTTEDQSDNYDNPNQTC
jgi:hypothetical protein